MLGGILALAAAATFGLNSVTIRRGVLSGTVAQGLAVSIPIGMPILLVAALVSGSFGLLSALPTSSFLLLAGAGVSHFVIGRYANFRSTKAMGANLVGPVISSNLIMTLALAIFYLDEILTPLRALGIILILGGPLLSLCSSTVRGKTATYTSTATFKPKLLEGYGFAILCALAFGASPILIRSALLDIEDAGPSAGVVGGLIAYTAAFLILILYLLRPKHLRHALEMDQNTAKWFSYTGLLVCISQMLRFMALAVAPVTVVSPIVQSTGVFRTLFGWYINREHEIFDGWVLVGVATTIVGAVALTMSVGPVIDLVDLPEGLATFLQLSWP